MTKLERINQLSGFIDSAEFIRINQLDTLNKKELSALHHKLVELSATYSLPGYLSLVGQERADRSSTKWKVITATLSVLAILTSILLAVYSF